jgi:hypothetical protein
MTLKKEEEDKGLLLFFVFFFVCLFLMDEDQAQKRKSRRRIIRADSTPRFFIFILFLFNSAFQDVVDLDCCRQIQARDRVNVHSERLVLGRQGSLAKPHGHDGNSSNDKRCAGNTNGNSRLG